MTQFYLTNMNKPLPLLLFRDILPYNCLFAIKLTGAEHQTLTGFHG